MTGGAPGDSAPEPGAPGEPDGSGGPHRQGGSRDARGRRLHRLLRRALLPGWFRARHGAAMGEAFGRALERERDRGGSRGAARIWLRELLDLTAAGTRLRVRGRPSGRSAVRTTNTGREGTMGIREAWDDAVLAFRGLARAPRFTLFAAGTLALGLGASTAVFSALEGVVLNPLPFPESDRLVGFWRSAAGGQGLIVPRAEQVEAWAELDGAFEAVRGYRSGSSVLTGRGDPVPVTHFEAGEGLFELLGADVVRGRNFTADEHSGEGARVVLLSEGLWTRRFGRDPDILGRSVSLDGEPWTVVGVVSDLPDPMSGTRPVAAWAALGRGVQSRSVSAVGLLREGVDVEAANARLDAFAEGVDDAGLGDPAEWRGRVYLIAEFAREGISATLRMLMGAVVLLLVIACVNVANLLLHRSVRARRETAVRVALGAGRVRLLRHSLLGSLMLGLMGAGGGAVVAWGALRLVDAVRPEQMRLLEGLELDPGVLLFGLAAAVAASLLFGAFPALHILRDPGTVHLRGGARGGTSGVDGSRLRWALVAGEVALSFALLVGATAILGSLREMQARDPGFEPEGLYSVSVSLPGWKYEEEALREEAFDRIQGEVARLPGVADVLLTTGLPPDLGALFGRLQVEGDAPEEETAFIRTSYASGGIVQLLRQPLVAGRDLAPGDADEGSGRPAVIGRTLAERLFPGAPPSEVLGRRFRVSEEGDYHTVVGVAEDVLTHLGSGGGEDQAYFPLTTTYSGHVLGVRVAAASARPDPALIRDLVREVEPDAFVDVVSAPAAMAATLGRQRFTAALLSGFAAVALVLSAVGLYGVLSQAVGERTREIGIRMSLGADAARVRRMVLRGGAGATLAGLVAGVGLALLALRLATSRLGGLTGLEEPRPSAWLVAGAALAGVALLATWMPARRATRIAPTEAIRAE